MNFFPVNKTSLSALMLIPVCLVASESIRFLGGYGIDSSATVLLEISGRATWLSIGSEREGIRVLSTSNNLSTVLVEQDGELREISIAAGAVRSLPVQAPTHDMFPDIRSDLLAGLRDILHQRGATDEEIAIQLADPIAIGIIFKASSLSLSGSLSGSDRIKAIRLVRASDSAAAWGAVRNPIPIAIAIPIFLMRGFPIFLSPFKIQSRSVQGWGCSVEAQSRQLSCVELYPVVSGGGGKSFVFCNLLTFSRLRRKNGGEGDTRIRTRMNQFVIAPTLSNDWADGVMVVHPFTLGEPVIRRAKQVVKFKILKGKHLLETALDWQAEIAANPHIQTVDVARDAGVTTGRVRQIMRMLRLHPEIQAAILEGSKEEGRSRFPERMLRRWTVLSAEQQLVQFESIQHSL